MKVILSMTHDPYYSFFAPIVTWSWNKLGVEAIWLVPKYEYEERKVFECIIGLGWDGYHVAKRKYYFFNCPKHKEATYSQVGRLFGGSASFEIPYDETVITGDIDMAVFSKELLIEDGNINIWGTDLVPHGQFPMCYISMPAYKWKEVMWCDRLTYQELLDVHLGHENCLDMRGNLWARDQETAFNYINGKHEFVSHPRARPGTQFASRREDRDGWGQADRSTLIDAHLPRPGYLSENFHKIITLFRDIYPEEDFTWMERYRDQFVSLL